MLTIVKILFAIASVQAECGCEEDGVQFCNDAGGDAGGDAGTCDPCSSYSTQQMCSWHGNGWYAG